MDKKITKQELVTIIKDNFTDKFGDIDISGLDFGKCESVNISGMKLTGNIRQSRHENDGNIQQILHENNGDVFQDKHKNKGDIYQSQHENDGKVWVGLGR